VLEKYEPEPEPVTEPEPEPPVEMPHPFAVALAQFMADVDDQAIAFLVDVDGNGIEGMVVINKQIFYPQGTLFYLYNGVLHSYDVGVQGEGYSTGVTLEGNRLVNLFGDGGAQWGYVLFGIESGQLITTLSISGGIVSSYENDSGEWVNEFDYRRNGESIPQDEFNEIRARYRLGNVRNRFTDGFVDETQTILSMTILVQQ